MRPRTARAAKVTILFSVTLVSFFPPFLSFPIPFFFLHSYQKPTIPSRIPTLSPQRRSTRNKPGIGVAVNTCSESDSTRNDSSFLWVQLVKPREWCRSWESLHYLNCVPGDAASVERSLHPLQLAEWKTTRGVTVTGYKSKQIDVSADARGHSRQWEGPS